MKIILLLMSSLFMLSIKEKNFDNFYEEINDGYSEYIKNVFDNEEYYLDIVKGIYNDIPSYGICFQPKVDDVTLVVKLEDEYYELNKKDDYYYATALKANLSIELYLFDDEGNKKAVEELEYSRLDNFSVKNFETEESIKGNGNGKVFTTLSSYKLKIRNYKVIIIACSVITLVCGLLVIIKLISKYKNKPQKTSYLFDEEVNAMMKRIDSNQLYEEKVEEKVLPSANDEEVKEYIKDLKEHLMVEGYNVSYELLNGEEKNKITMYLMKLKEEQKISNDQYLEEMYKIWKS